MTSADQRFSNQVRERDRWTCQRCWFMYPAVLDCAHMFGRWKPETRFDPDNACALCRSCHTHLDTHPEEKRAFFLRRLGADRFAALERRSNRTNALRRRAVVTIEGGNHV